MATFLKLTEVKGKLVHYFKKFLSHLHGNFAISFWIFSDSFYIFRRTWYFFWRGLSFRNFTTKKIFFYSTCLLVLFVVKGTISEIEYSCYWQNLICFFNASGKIKLFFFKTSKLLNCYIENNLRSFKNAMV